MEILTRLGTVKYCLYYFAFQENQGVDSFHIARAAFANR